MKQPRLWMFSLAILFAGLIAVPAHADDAADCVSNTGNAGISSCTRAIESGQWHGADLAKLYYLRGFTKLGLGDSKGAIEDYSRAIELNPKYALAYYIRGFAKAGLGDSKGAIEDYSRAIELNPNDALAYSNRCMLHAFDGKLTQAMADCNNSLRLKPGDAETLAGRGLVYLKMKSYPAAFADYDAAFKINPKKASYLFGRGIAKNLSDPKHVAGKEDIAKAKQLDPGIEALYRKHGVNF